MLSKNEKCPVCKGTEKCEIDSSGFGGDATPRTRLGGAVDLTLCLNCGCVYVGKDDLIRHRRNLK